MKLSKNLDQFEKNTLILVTSNQTAKFYKAHQGHIDQIHSIEVDTPTFSDDEGHFARSGDGKRYGSGSTEKDVEALARRDFLQKFRLAIDDLEDNFESVILFSPSHLLPDTLEHLPARIKKNIERTIEGNVVHEPANKIAERIS